MTSILTKTISIFWLVNISSTTSKLIKQPVKNINYQLIKVFSQKDEHQKQKFNLIESNQEQWITQIVIVLLQK